MSPSFPACSRRSPIADARWSAIAALAPLSVERLARPRAEIADRPRRGLGHCARRVRSWRGYAALKPGAEARIPDRRGDALWPRSRRARRSRARVSGQSRRRPRPPNCRDKRRAAAAGIDAPAQSRARRHAGARAHARGHDRRCRRQPAARPRSTPISFISSRPGSIGDSLCCAASTGTRRPIFWKRSFAMKRFMRSRAGTICAAGWSRRDRRLYAFFHPALGDEPLIFVEVALTDAIPAAIAPLLASDRTELAAAGGDDGGVLFDLQCAARPCRASVSAIS